MKKGQIILFLLFAGMFIYLLLRAVYVEPRYRGMGYGKQLVKLAMEKHGGPLRLECNTELVPYYEKLGFRKKRLTWRRELHTMQQDR